MAVAAGVGAWMTANAATIAAVSSVAATAVSVAGTISAAASQSAQAKAQANYQEAMNKRLAVQAAASYDDLTPAEIDAQRNAADQELQQKAEAMEAKGRVNVFAAAAGTAGQSVDSVLFNIDAIKARNTNEILRQREAGLLSIKNQAEQTRQSAMSSMSNQSLQRPSWLETGLKAGTQILSGAANYYGRYQDTYSKTEKAQVKGSV